MHTRALVRMRVIRLVQRFATIQTRLTDQPLNGGRLLFHRFNSFGKSGIFLSLARRAHVDIHQSTQKIQCTFKVDIPDMGHLDGGRERDVRIEGPCRPCSFPSHPPG